MSNLFKRRAEPVTAKQWNKLAKLAKDCADDERVKAATYNQIVELCKNNGLFNKPPYFSYEYLGVISVNGITRVVSPGNYIITDLCGNIYVISSQEFNRDFEPY